MRYTRSAFGSGAGSGAGPCSVSEQGRVLLWFPACVRCLRPLLVSAALARCLCLLRLALSPFRPGGSLTRLENAVAFHGMAQEKRRPYWR
jgi:hypothetical protein